MAKLQANQSKSCAHFCASLKHLFLDYQEEIKSQSIQFPTYLLLVCVVCFTSFDYKFVHIGVLKNIQIGLSGSEVCLATQILRELKCLDLL